MDSNNVTREAIIVPHTHWDREWYKPFQFFRANLVKLIDKLLEINKNQDYYFMLDGQTIVLEDYFEIRPEKKDELLELIRKQKIDVGPWYILPDEWLVGQESLIRNIEISYILSRRFNIPLMKHAYLPDQFGHTRAIPQLISHLTDFGSTILWRGVGNEITTVPFQWKGSNFASKSLFGVYMPYGYGNAAYLSNENEKELETNIEMAIKELEPFSPFNLYLLMNGTDHQFPKEHIPQLLKKLNFDNLNVKIGSIDEFVAKLKKKIEQEKYSIPEYSGEFRSPARAPLLQDTYSARMWIKQWNQKTEDLLVHYAEPLQTYLSYYLGENYPHAYFEIAWKWLLKNQPHDSICGCSVDQTHEEMKSRFYWAESIAEVLVDQAKEKLAEEENEKIEVISVYNPSNSPEKTYFEFSLPIDIPIKTLVDEKGNHFSVQPLHSTQDVILDEQMKPFMLKSGLKLLPGRQIVNDYINKVIITKNEEKRFCEIKVICGKKPVGELDISQMKKDLIEIIDSGKFKLFHVFATRGMKQNYAAVAPLKPWSFNNFRINIEEREEEQNKRTIIASKNYIENEFYKVKFKRDGTFDLLDKTTGKIYSRLHEFEDSGDKGDEYTFGFIGPIKKKLSKVKRKVISTGNVFSVIEQKATLVTFNELNEKRNKRKGKRKISITSIFKFYKDSPRIDVETKLTNSAKDHRLRITFNLPFSSEYTLTSTHFGYIKRKGSPEELKEYVEKPSGIQAQKRWIRVENKEGKEAFTLINKGLPEIELVERKRLALTLIRSVGWLSRQDFEERPLHAGPFLATPGAQELNKEYTYTYSIIAHTKKESVVYSDNLAENVCLPPLSIIANKKLKEGFSPLIFCSNEWIRVSSIRKREEEIVVTLYNLSEEKQQTVLIFPSDIKKIEEILIDGTIVNKVKLERNEQIFEFDPIEIKMIKLVKE